MGCRCYFCCNWLEKMRERLVIPLGKDQKLAMVDSHQLVIERYKNPPFHPQNSQIWNNYINGLSNYVEVGPARVIVNGLRA